jgi:hypothetical protein
MSCTSIALVVEDPSEVKDSVYIIATEFPSGEMATASGTPLAGTTVVTRKCPVEWVLARYQAAKARIVKAAQLMTTYGLFFIGSLAADAATSAVFWF